MSDITGSTKNASDAAQKIVQTIKALVELPKAVREAYREFILDSVIDKINERLYGRYTLIHALENFGRMIGPEEEFREVIKTARDRAIYLRDFNRKIEPRIKTRAPKLAADLIALTKESIKLYERLAETENAEQLAQAAPGLAEDLNKMAEYLEKVNKNIRDLIPES